MPGSNNVGSERRLREATERDIPTIRALARTTWEVAYRSILSPAQLRYMLELMYRPSALSEQLAAGHRFILIEDGKTPLGFASHSPMGPEGVRTRLHKLYVLPEAQGSGAGRALLDAVEARAAAAGHRAVEFNVNKHNPAIAFYERCGYRVIRSEVNDIGEGFVMDDHVMEKSIAP